MDRFHEAQAAIDALFANSTGKDETPASDRILAYAKRGVSAPESLSHKEMQQICYALMVHYAQMGIE